MSKIQQPTENTNCWHTEKFHSWLSLAICSPNKLGREQLRIYFNIINTVITAELTTWTQVAILSLAATSYQNLSQVRTYSDSNCTETWRITTHQKITKITVVFLFIQGEKYRKTELILEFESETQSYFQDEASFQISNVTYVTTCIRLFILGVFYLIIRQLNRSKASMLWKY